MKTHMNIEKYNREVNDINTVTNCYYIMAEATDMLMREMERKFKGLNKDVKHHVKQRHTEMMRLMRMLKSNQEKFVKDYEAFHGDWSQYDALRNSAAYISRIMLLISDRCEKDIRNYNKIEKYIYDKKPTGIVSDEMLNRFRIK